MEVPLHFKFWHILLYKPFLAALLAQQSAQLFKVLSPLFQRRAPDPRRYFDYGGLPSAHTAFVVGITVSIGVETGWHSPMAALAVVVASIVIYDTVKLRKAVEVNLVMTKELYGNTGLPVACGLPQFKSHSVGEIIAGAAWGALCAIAVGFL